MLFPRRINGKYITPECEHLKAAVKRVGSGEYEEKFKELFSLTEEELANLYNNREIE